MTDEKPGIAPTLFSNRSVSADYHMRHDYWDRVTLAIDSARSGADNRERTGPAGREVEGFSLESRLRRADITRYL
jgi:hypothetical protein